MPPEADWASMVARDGHFWDLFPRPGALLLLLSAQTTGSEGVSISNPYKFQFRHAVLPTHTTVVQLRPFRDTYNAITSVIVSHHRYVTNQRHPTPYQPRPYWRLSRSHTPPASLHFFVPTHTTQRPTQWRGNGTALIATTGRTPPGKSRVRTAADLNKLAATIVPSSETVIGQHRDEMSWK